MCLIDRERADGRAGSEWARVAFKVRGLKHCTRHDRQKRRKRIICGRKRWIECTDCLAKDKYSIRLVSFSQLKYGKGITIIIIVNVWVQHDQGTLTASRGDLIKYKLLDGDSDDTFQNVLVAKEKALLGLTN